MKYYYSQLIFILICFLLKVDSTKKPDGGEEGKKDKGKKQKTEETLNVRGIHFKVPSPHPPQIHPHLHFPHHPPNAQSQFHQMPMPNLPLQSPTPRRLSPFGPSSSHHSGPSNPPLPPNPPPSIGPSAPIQLPPPSLALTNPIPGGSIPPNQPPIIPIGPDPTNNPWFQQIRALFYEHQNELDTVYGLLIRGILPPNEIVRNYLAIRFRMRRNTEEELAAKFNVFIDHSSTAILDNFVRQFPYPYSAKDNLLGISADLRRQINDILQRRIQQLVFATRHISRMGQIGGDAGQLGAFLGQLLLQNEQNANEEEAILRERAAAFASNRWGGPSQQRGADNQFPVDPLYPVQIQAQPQRSPSDQASHTGLPPTPPQMPADFGGIEKFEFENQNLDFPYHGSLTQLLQDIDGQPQQRGKMPAEIDKEPGIESSQRRGATRGERGEEGQNEGKREGKGVAQSGESAGSNPSPAQTQK